MPTLEEGWDMVVERDIEVEDEGLNFRELYVLDTPESVPVGAGWNRVRVAVRDRLAAARQSPPTDMSIEKHRIQVWPVDEPSEPRVVVGPDEYARRYLS
ncbi:MULTISPECIES: hypothetical protein [unclassified Amycolatopsis]|uniref:hypothetical protein n=1 Tax=unclassified Amycolatopsis TaxID=2618356 RepID=UPI001C6976DB|nr:hypothetical protein [Amycolatopsis sp. DSM 110486]QYN20137.1 hypothetical protein K1T34_47595 [Amycolatopsis sp. DSM 110486]